MKQPAMGELRYGSALMIARVFKVLAVLTLLGGAITLGGGLATMGGESAAEIFAETGASLDDPVDVPVDIPEDDDWKLAFAAIVIASTIVSAAVLAFFGFVLEILVDIFEQAWNTRFAVEEEA